MTLETATLPLVASLFLGSVLFLIGYLVQVLRREEPQPIRVRVNVDPRRDLPRHDGSGNRGYDC